MASLTITGVPDALLDALRKRAEQHRRSLNSEVLQLLDISTTPRPVDSEVLLTRIHRLQERVPLPPLTDAILEEAINDGRL